MQAEPSEKRMGLSCEEAITHHLSEEPLGGEESTSRECKKPENKGEGWWTDDRSSRKTSPATKKEHGKDEASSIPSAVMRARSMIHGSVPGAEPADTHLPQTRQNKGAKISLNTRPAEEDSEDHSDNLPESSDSSGDTGSEQSITEPSEDEKGPEIPSKKNKESEQGAVISIPSDDPSQGEIDLQDYPDSSPAPSPENRTSDVQPPVQLDHSSPHTTQHPWTPPPPPTMESHLSP